MGIGSHVFQRAMMLASVVFLVAFLGVSVYLFAKPEQAINWYMSLKNQGVPEVSPTTLPQAVLDTAQPTPLPVVFANEALGGEHTASGIVQAFDAQTRDVWLKSLGGDELKVKLVCEDMVEVIDPAHGESQQMSEEEAMERIAVGVQVFGKCNNKECAQLVSKCMLVLQ
jgi:hypothetical protein